MRLKPVKNTPADRTCLLVHNAFNAQQNIPGQSRVPPENGSFRVLSDFLLQVQYHRLPGSVPHENESVVPRDRSVEH